MERLHILLYGGTIMFWIGIIVGILLCAVAYFGLYLWATRHIFKSPDEYWDSIGIVYDATQNRESELQLVYDGDIQDSVTLEEW
jgi:hypothetical protein